MSSPYSIFERAEKKREASRFLEAIPLYLEAKRLSRHDRELKSSCWFALGDTYRMVGEFSRAGVCYRKAHGLAVRLCDEVRAYDALAGLGLSLRALGDFREAVSILNACLKGYRKLGDREGEAFTLWAKAGALRIKGDLNGAIRTFGEAKRVFRELGDRSGLGYCATGLGGASRVYGEIEDSYRYYKEANRIFTTLGDTFGIAYSYCGIANALRMKGRFDEALKFFGKARVNYKKIGDKVSYAYTLWGEGTAYQMLGRNKSALKDFLEARRLFEETNDRRGLVYCLLSLGELEMKRSPGKGISLIKSALRKAKGLGIGVEIRYAERVLDRALKKPGDLPLNLA